MEAGYLGVGAMGQPMLHKANRRGIQPDDIGSVHSSRAIPYDSPPTAPIHASLRMQMLVLARQPPIVPAQRAFFIGEPY